MLLNALTVAKLVSVNYMNYREVQAMSPFLKQKFLHLSSRLPIIEMEIGDFQREIIDYSEESIKSKP